MTADNEYFAAEDGAASKAECWAFLVVFWCEVVYGAMSKVRGKDTGVSSFDDLSFVWENR